MLTAISRDPELEKLRRSVRAFRGNDRTETGRLRFGSTKIAAVERLALANRTLKLGDELMLDAPIRSRQSYLVDIEIAAGSSTEDHVLRRERFSAYLRAADAGIVGAGPIVEEDYALFRAWIAGRVLLDLVDNHPHVLSIDTPPSIELEGMELLDIDNPRLPGSLEQVAAGPPIVVIDGGVIPEQPLIRRSLNGPAHRSFIPDMPALIDGGTDGHGTAIASVAALGSLRNKLLRPAAGDQVLPVAVARVLDDNTRLPGTVNVKAAIPEIATQMRKLNRARVFNHSLASASRAPFNRQRMSVWAEALDRTAYDDGGTGCLFVVAVSTCAIEGPKNTQKACCRMTVSY